LSIPREFEDGWIRVALLRRRVSGLSRLCAKRAREDGLRILQAPNTLVGSASTEHRASLAARAQVLSLSLDVQKTVQADKTIEKMMCHQLAALHTLGMEESSG